MTYNEAQNLTKSIKENIDLISEEVSQLEESNDVDYCDAKAGTHDDEFLSERADELKEAKRLLNRLKDHMTTMQVAHTRFFREKNGLLD